VALVFVVVSIGMPLLGTRTLAAGDMMFGADPWNQTLPVDAKTTRTSFGDTIEIYVPFLHQIGSRVRSGDAPLWNPLLAGGGPLAAVPNVGALDPLTAPWLVLPSWYAPGIAKLLEMGAAMGFTFLFCRRIGLGRAAGTLSAVVYAGSAFQVVWTNWPQTHVGALVPALFWAVERTVQRRRRRDIAVLAVVVAWLLFGGFPAVVAYALCLAVPYGALRMWAHHRHLPPAERWPRSGRGVGLLVLGLGLGAGLAAVQLGPFVEQLRVTDLDYRQQSPSEHLPVQALYTAVVPNIFGTPDQANTVAPLPPAGRYDYIELQSFVGAAAVALGFLAVARRRPEGLATGVKTFFLVGGAIQLVLVYVGGPALALVQHLPVFSTNFIGRVRSTIGFTAAVLAGVGLQSLLEPTTRRHSTNARRASVAVFVGIVTACFVLVLRKVVTAPPNLEGTIRAGALVAAGSGAAVVIGVVLAARPAGRRAAAIVIPAVAAAEALTLILPLWPRIGRDRFYPSVAATDFLARNQGSDRVAVDGLTLYGPAASYYGLRQPTGHSFHAKTWADVLSATDPKAFRLSPTYSTLALSVPGEVSEPLLDRLGVRYEVYSLGAPVPSRADVMGGPAGTMELRPGAPVTMSLPSLDGLRGVRVELARPFAAPSGLDALVVTVAGSSGRVIATGRRKLTPGASGAFSVPLAAEELPERPAAIRLAVDGTHGVTVVASASGSPVLAALVPLPDGRRLVEADGVAVYERLTNPGRIRWASRAIVVGDPTRRLALLRAGVEPGTVVLDSGPVSASGSSAHILAVDEDDPDRIEIDVDAGGAGYVVVADAIQHGWEATLDGRTTSLVAADHAFVAVPVPGGRHTITIHYRPGHWPWVVYLSAVVAVVLVALAATDRRRPDRRTPAG
jgi:hypothetical protein